MLKGSTVKEVNVCCRQNKFTVVAWSMFSQRKNCRIDEWPNLNGWNFDLIGRNSDLLDGIPIWLDGIWNWLDGILTWLNGMFVKVLMPEKKSAWTDLDRVRFKKIFNESNVETEKSAWTGLGKVKKRPLQRQGSLKCLSPRLATDLLLTRGAVVATPVAVAFSLTFSLVKNLKMLLQAKRQPG